MVGGMTGRLDELSKFLQSDNGWFGTDGEGWEEQPYWFRGFYALAALTGDERLLAEAKRWIEAILASQDADGYFGPPANKRLVGKNGQEMPDFWPNMIMLDALILHHEYTGDERVIPLMTRFFAYCHAFPDGSLLPDVQEGFGNWHVPWQRIRAGDMLPHLYWLYERTGERWLLDLAARFYRRITPPKTEWLDGHIVNFTQRFSYPGIFSRQSNQAWHLETSEYWYQQHLGTWGQQPRGIFGADERLRPGKVDPRQGFETCGLVEFAKSFYLLGRVTGDPLWADRVEDLLLNHFPVASTPDLRALHYLTASNQPQLDASEQHDYFNKGRQIDYSPHLYRCCQHNVAMGWPWYAQNLWQATPDGGLAAWLYAASEVTAQVGASPAETGRPGVRVTFVEHTDYPFRGRVTLTVRAVEGASWEAADGLAGAGASGATVAFPLYLRVPRWCRRFSAAINGIPLDPVDADSGRAAAAHHVTRVAGLPDSSGGVYLRIARAWAAGDVVEIDMAMHVSLTEWPRTGAVTVDRGPLSYSVRIGERWQQCGGTPSWPEWEVLPTNPWNYGLIVDRERPADSLVVQEESSIAPQPWTVDAAPVTITARAKRIAAWGLVDETVAPLQASPIRSDSPEETITLVPLGCARLRIACLPVIGDGADAREWV
jgi:DUF1680 family protein